jgi:hypothetical protein
VQVTEFLKDRMNHDADWEEAAWATLLNSNQDILVLMQKLHDQNLITTDMIQMATLPTKPPPRGDDLSKSMSMALDTGGYSGALAQQQAANAAAAAAAARGNGGANGAGGSHMGDGAGAGGSQMGGPHMYGGSGSMMGGAEPSVDGSWKLFHRPGVRGHVSGRHNLHWT